MKALSLPVNMIVIMAVAIVVLLAAVTFFSGVIPIMGTISDYDALNRGCAIWKERGCEVADIINIKISGYDPDRKGTATLFTACKRVFGSDFSAQKCHIKCCAVE